MRRSPAALAAVALAVGLLVPTHDAVAAPQRAVRAATGGPSPSVTSGVRQQSQRRAVPPAAQPADPRLRAAALAQRPGRDGTVRVLVDGDRATVQRAVHALGGRVLVGAGSTSSVVIAKGALTTLAARAGVTAVDAISRPVEADVTPGPSQAVTRTGADDWHDASQTGAGIKIGIVDDSFGVSQAEYDNEVAAGHLGTNPQLDPGDCADANNVRTPFDDGSHGLAVAELASQQAPGAQLYLYCVNTRAGVAAAESAMRTNGITIATSSLNWFADARGDGTGPSGSVAATVKRARQDGILWFNSAGNDVPQHYGSLLADADHDGVIDMGNHNETVYPFESNFYYTAPGSGGAPTSLVWQYQWDAWPTTTERATLTAYGVQCTAADGTGGIDNCQGVYLGSVTQTNPANSHTPTLALSTDDFPNTSRFVQIWQIQISYVGKKFTPGRHYDLFGFGDTAFASDLSCPSADSAGRCVYSANAKAQSISSPANSPYAVAVGAANSGADGSGIGTLERFSSQGPTIDGRIKPELLGWDGVSSYVPEFSTGFYGTSAASPVAAGSAALVAAAVPGIDPAALLDLLERRAHYGTPNNPPSSASGYGVVTLGSPGTAAAPPGARYQAVTPTRILDTRGRAKLGTGGTVTVTVPGLPADATAVAINLTGVGATALTYVSAYPGGTAWPGTSNLNLRPGTDPTAAVFAVVTVKNKQITIRNAGGSVDVLVDELGYFGTGSETGGYTTLATPKRVADNAGFAPHQQRTIDPNLPAGATVAVVNVTTANTTAAGFVAAAPRCSIRTSTVNFGRYPRANLAFVQLDGAGRFCIANGATAAHAYVDVVGYVSPTGDSYVALPAAQRIVDTRTGNGGSAGGRPSKPIAGGAGATQFYAAGIGTVPITATALFTGVVEASNGSGGYLTMFPGVRPPATSTLNYTPGRVVANAAAVGLSGPRFAVYTNIGSTHVAVDLFGYFRPDAG